MKFTAICQSNQQVKWLLQQPEYSEKITNWIAANPSAYWELRKHHVQFSTLDDGQIIKSSDDIESLQREQIIWAQNVDTFLQERFPNFKSYGFCPAQNYLFYLKIACDTWINRADLLECISNKIAPINVIYFGNLSRNYSADLTPAFSVLSECIPLWADNHDIQLTHVPPIPGDNIWQQQEQMRTGIRRRITSKLPQFIINRAQSLLHNRIFLDFPSIFGYSNIKEDLLIRNSYDLTGDVPRYLIEHGRNPQSFDVAVIKSQNYRGSLDPLDPSLDKAWYEIRELDWFWKPRGWQNWSLRNGFEPLYHHFWFTILPVLWNSFFGSLKFLEKTVPKAICVPSIWEPKETGFIMAARSKKIPVIFYQHGACMGDIENSAWDLTDSNYGDFILVYGDGEANYLRLRPAAFKTHAIPVPVGSSRLDRISNRISQKKRLTHRSRILKKFNSPLVVYVPGVITNNYFRYDYQNFHHCQTFNLRYQLAEVFNKHPEVQFSYKGFTSFGHDPTLEMLKETCPSCSIIDSISLTELHWIADLIIHEVPGTGMYEGLVTDKPMIVYVDSEIYRMPPDVKNILGKRAIIAKTSQELINQVSQFLDRGNFSPLPSPDRDFVKKFCTYLDDGKSALRAANAIDDIIQKWPKK